MALSEAPAATVTPSEEESFWKMCMPAGIASTASDANIHSKQDGDSTAVGDSANGHKVDDRGGKWARGQGQRGKVKDKGARAATAAGARIPSTKIQQRRRINAGAMEAVTGEARRRSLPI